ncbi:MAG: protein-methionine-sulfoxide reductase catalytic subunit MsrP [Pseudomonadota bacterium]
MLIRHRSPGEPLSSEITPETIHQQRRTLLKAAGLFGAAAFFSPLPATARASAARSAPSTSAPPSGAGAPSAAVPAASRLALPPYTPAPERDNAPLWLRQKIQSRRLAANATGEALTPFQVVSSYNNFYEFGMGKEDPAVHAGRLRTEPWSLRVEGLCARPGLYTLEDILKPHALEDRIYRFRCVEAWSMVVPWLGFPLADLLRRFAPASQARYVEFTTLQAPDQMPGLQNRSMPWPYVEGLRLDEAMHPLALMSLGVYGRSLPPQNGAPLRLVLPWKYGFKSIKSIVRIRFTARQPATTWARLAPDEYGFYANVNPAIDHPRWTQSRERRLPGTFFNPNWRDTLPFNGYAREVTGLYRGMDLKRFF